ncbi:MAG: HAD family phosphatase [Chitinophagales bacterium]|nr:HAD family phosphatase [Bacteroidota bacterium]
MLKNIKNIIFDLGEVIVDLDFNRTEQAFTNLFNVPAHQLYSYHKQNHLFDDLETGKISPSEFRNSLKKNLPKNTITDREIDDAWNAMLLDISSQKIELVKKLRQNYQTFVLSNTNKIHIDYVDQQMLPKHNLKSLNEIFDFVYYSHIIKHRKPDKEAYTFILDKHNLTPQQTLFIDDKAENIESARNLNMHTWHLTNRNDLYKIDEILV